MLIKGRRIIADRWTVVLTAGELPANGDVIVSLAIWKMQRERLGAREGRVGVLLRPEDDPAELDADLSHLALVAVEFPHFTDGRGYSTASLLRGRHGYRGELRAVGDVGRDQLFYLSRVGFDAFALREGERPEQALGALEDFSEAYQASIDRLQPLFRRRSGRDSGAAKAHLSILSDAGTPPKRTGKDATWRL